MPVFDIAAPTKSSDKITGVKYVERNLKRTEKIAEKFSAIFVDSSELGSTFRITNKTHPLVGAANSIASAGTLPIPVTGLHRDTEHQKAVSSILRRNKKELLCIRLDFTDIGTATLTFKGIQEYLSEKSIKSSNVYLLLDLQCLFGLDKNVVLKMIFRLFELLRKKKWAGIILGGYGIPDQLSSAVSTNDQLYLTRIEQEIFFDIVEFQLGSEIWFSDYTTLSPTVVELDWRLIQKVMAPKALYTLEDSWFVVRGGAFSRHPDGYDQYYSIAEQIVALDEYCGEDYCYGDQYIWECSQRTRNPGSPASWITACVNHHLTLTAETYAI